MARTASTSILKDLTLDFGPVTKLGLFLLRAEAAIRDRGVLLSFASFDDLVRINHQNLSTWAPLLPTFHPAYCHLDQGNSFCMIGRNQAGDIVSTQAARKFDWQRTDFKAEAESLRMLYDDPDKGALPGERCIVTAPGARVIAGRIAYMGGVWYRPDFRGRGLQAIVARIARAYAVGLWNIDFAVANVAEANFARGFHIQIGHTHVEWAADFFNGRPGTYRAALLWMRCSEVLDDLAAVSGSAVAEIDRFVKHRVA